MKEIQNGIKELHRILSKSCCFMSREFTEAFLKEIKAQSGNENLTILCKCIIDRKK